MHNEQPLSFEAVFDACLEEIICFNKDVDDCLKKYPEHADELKPLLNTVAASREAAQIYPRREFKARARYEFYAAVDDMASQKKFTWFSLTSKWIQVTVSAAIGLLITGTGVLAASSGSLPGQPLYNVKIFSEQVQTSFVTSDAARIELHSNFASNRVGEIVALSEAGDYNLIPQTTQRLNASLMNMSGSERGFQNLGLALTVVDNQPGIVSTPPVEDAREIGPDNFAVHTEDNELTVNLKRKAMDGYNALAKEFNDAPENLKPALEEALVVFIQGYQAIIENVR